MSPEGVSQRVVPQGGFTMWFPVGGSLGWFPRVLSNSDAIGWRRLQPAGPKLVTVARFGRYVAADDHPWGGAKRCESCKDSAACSLQG